MGSATGVTRGEQVYAQLRADVLSGDHRPGSKMRLVELATRYGCSMTVVREALNRLVEQGLVHAEPQHGFRVITLSVEDLDDLVEARCQIEGTALHLAIEHGDLAWESAIVAAHHALSRTTELGAGDARQPDDWVHAHRRFHEALLDSCPNRRLRAIASSLRASAELYRQSSANSTRDVAGEHEQLMDAALARQADRAVGLLTDHLRATAHNARLRLPALATAT